jgi:hypothetical protein
MFVGEAAATARGAVALADTTSTETAGADLGFIAASVAVTM